MCADLFILSDDEWKEYSGKEVLFNNEAIRKAFHNFRILHSFDVEESSMSSLIRFDAMMTDIVQCFESIIKSAEGWADSGTSSLKKPEEVHKEKFWSKKGRSTPHKNASGLVDLVPDAARNLLQYYLQV